MKEKCCNTSSNSKDHKTPTLAFQKQMLVSEAYTSHALTLSLPFTHTPARIHVRTHTHTHTHLEQGSCARVNDADLLVLAGGGQSAAVHVEGHGQNHVLVHADCLHRV